MSPAKTVECNVIGNIDWNGFIHDLMKDIHIIAFAIKPEGYGRYIHLLTFTYVNLMRVGFFLLRENPLNSFFLE